MLVFPTSHRKPIADGQLNGQMLHSSKESGELFKQFEWFRFYIDESKKFSCLYRRWNFRDRLVFVCSLASWELF